jgi:hypothetical protein
MGGCSSRRDFLKQREKIPQARLAVRFAKAHTRAAGFLRKLLEHLTVSVAHKNQRQIKTRLG